MSFGAFMRGMGGGLAQLGSDMQRRDELAQQLLAREKEREDERKFRAEQAERERLLKEELLAQRLGAGGGSSGSRGARGALDPAALAAEADGYVASRLAESEGMSLPEAQAALGVYKSGQNPYRKTVDDESGGHDEPDVARFKSLMSKVGSYYARSKADLNGKAQDLANSEQTRWETASGQAAQNPAMPADRVTALARGTAIASGKAPFDSNGDNVITGQTGALTQAQVRAEDALAGKRRADANGTGGEGVAKVARTYTNSAGQMVAIMRDGTERVLGTSKDYASMIEAAKKTLAKTMDGATMKPDELEQRAVEIVAQRGRPTDKPAEAPKPAASAAAKSEKPAAPKKVAALPQGAKFIGYSKGDRKKVYELPDGTRIKEE